MAGKNAKVPWFEPLTPADFDQWAKEDPEGFNQYFAQMTHEFNSIASQLAGGEPHPMAYELQENDPKYQSAVRIWEHEVAQERVAARHEKPAPPPPQRPEPRELTALRLGTAEEKARAVKISKDLATANELYQKAEDHKRAGRVSRERDARELADMYVRAARNLQRQKYGFEVQQETDAVKYGLDELEKAMDMTAEEVEKNRDHLEGLIQGFRDLSDSEYSFAMDYANKRVVKVNHPGIEARHIEAKIGNTDNDILLRKFAPHGIEGREDETPKKEEPGKPMGEMTEGDYNKYVEGEESKARESAGGPFGGEVRPGMFGG